VSEAPWELGSPEQIIPLTAPPIWGPQAGENTFRWGTVTQESPLRVRLDGDVSEIDATPYSLVAALSVGQRVWVQLWRRRVLVLGAASTGALSSPVWTTLSYATGCQSPGFGHTPAYRIVGGLVFTRGTVGKSSGSFADGDPLVVIPPEAYAGATVYGIVPGSGNRYANTQLSSNSSNLYVKNVQTTGTTWVSLDQLHWALGGIA
jgi:hypothetical protein